MSTHRLGRRLASVLLAAAVAVPLAAVASGGSAFGTTYTVPCNGGDPTALITAINNANATPTADTINLASGCTYVFTAPDNNGYDGPNALPIITTPITINGNSSTLQRSATSGTPAFRLLDVSNTGNLTTSYLTLTNGLLVQGPMGVGAGLLNFGKATLKFTKVDGNHVEINDYVAVAIGGGIANQGGILSVSNSDVSYNGATVPPQFCGPYPCGPGALAGIPLGGGIGNTGTTTISSSTITNNEAGSFSYLAFAFGGGIASGNASTPTVTISSSKVTDNTVTGYADFGLAVGGGFAGNALNMSSTEVARNSAIEYSLSGGAFGGGISVLAASNISSSSSIHDNSAASSGTGAAGGGVDIAQGATLTINSSAIFSNVVNSDYTVSRGGGIRNAGTLTLNSSRVSGNSAVASNGGVTAAGGGIFNESGGSVKLVNSSVKTNSADTTGGGVYNADASPTAVSGSVASITTNTPNNCVNVQGCVG